MKFDIKGIIEGAINSIFVNQEVEKVHKERITICDACPMNSTYLKEHNGYKTFRPDYHCGNCGCNLDMKTRCMSCECPEGKWDALMSGEEEQHMMDKLKEDASND